MTSKTHTQQEVQQIREKYNFRPFVDAPSSKEKVDLLDLTIIDLGKFEDGPEARKGLADSLEKALTEYGFFRVVNHGFSPEFLDQLKSIDRKSVV